MNELNSVQDAARYLGVTERTVYTYIKAGILPASRLGTRWRIRQADLEGLVKRTSLAIIEDVVKRGDA